jgi:ferredoxin
MTSMTIETEARVRWKVTLDQEVCQGYACCVMAVPTVFDLDDETGKAKVINSEPADSLREAVAGAVRGCPVRAISIQDR